MGMLDGALCAVVVETGWVGLGESGKSGVVFAAVAVAIVVVAAGRWPGPGVVVVVVFKAAGLLLVGLLG